MSSAGYIVRLMVALSRQRLWPVAFSGVTALLIVGAAPVRGLLVGEPGGTLTAWVLERQAETGWWSGQSLGPETFVSGMSGLQWITGWALASLDPVVAQATL
ncbi:MAG: hypothetical protein QGG40_14220, partial [Myxococcota bacterium]|nr:hypothetical protein [Myxococcota bacterium]